MPSDVERPDAPGRPEPEYLTVTSGLPQVREVSLAAPWRWLRLGLPDQRAPPV